MNIFYIPSWYPSDTNPAWGIFCKEQVEALAETFPDSNFCVSLWGQNFNNTFLFAKDHIKNTKKILRFNRIKGSQQSLRENLVEYNTPSLTWTRKIANGNIIQIIKANEHNFKLFTQKFGKPDIIHAHVGYPAGYIAMHLSRKFSVPYIITEHMAPFPFDTFKKKDGTLIPAIDKSYRNSSAIIAVSEALKSALEKMSFKNVVYIPNMVNGLLFTPNNYKKSKGQFSFLFVGGLIDRKGVSTLLEAISLIDERENIGLTIVGEGVEENKYKVLAKKLSIDRTVTWTGILNRTEVIKKIQQCDTMILVSRQENLPMVLLEAIACGKPIIVTRCGGPEVIVNDKNGILVDVDDAHQLAQAMVQMLEQHDQYDAKEIRKDFEERFSIPIVTSQIMEAYRNAIAEVHQENR